MSKWDVRVHGINLDAKNQDTLSSEEKERKIEKKQNIADLFYIVPDSIMTFLAINLFL